MYVFSCFLYFEVYCSDFGLFSSKCLLVVVDFIGFTFLFLNYILLFNLYLIFTSLVLILLLSIKPLGHSSIKYTFYKFYKPIVELLITSPF